MEKKLFINMSNGNKIVVEALDWHDEFPNDIAVYLCDKNDVVIQDICLVREHYDIDEENGEIGVDNKLVDCFVWDDEYYEDYTHMFVIPVREKEEE